MDIIRNFRDKKDSPDQKASVKMENTSLVQRCSVFSRSPLSVTECIEHISLILQAIFTGERFSANDTETIFFTMTQVFSNKDPTLHRLIILALRHLRVSPDSAIMVTQALSKDISSDMPMNQCHSVRLLPHILSVDAVLVQDRFIKQIIIARDPFLAASGLSCALALCRKGAMEVIKWISEINMASNGCVDAQYLALLVMFLLRRGDGSMLRKMADQRKGLAGMATLPAHVMICVCDEAMKLSNSESAENFIVGRLQSSSAVSQIDAARAILGNKQSSEKAINAAVTKLNALLAAPANITVYAALRTIAMHAAAHRDEFSKCNPALERTLSQGDGSMSALAAMSLLHTGFESTIERVLPTIAGFATGLTTSQQVEMLRSCVEVARRHPSKLETVLTFISSTFRMVDDFQVQRILVEAFFNFAENLVASRTSVFRFLCEYLEDSKFMELSVLVVNFIGKFGVQQDNKSELVRCLCNRLSLEGAEVRASSIDALFAFAQDPELGESVCKIIRMSLNDVDDEVRDRATFYTQIIEKKLTQLLVEVPSIESIAGGDEADSKAEGHPKSKISPLEIYGACEHKSIRIKATEDDADIVVSYVTRLFKDVVIFDFSITNTLPTGIVDVTVSMSETDDAMNPTDVIPAVWINSNEKERTYVVFTRSTEERIMFGSFSAAVNFRPEGDRDSEETFELDSAVDMKIAAYVKPTTVTNFDMAFAQATCSKTESVRLGKMRTIEEVVRFFVESTGLEVVSKEDVVSDAKKRKMVVVKMGGLLLGDEIILVVVEIAPATRIGGFPVRITVKSSSEDTVDAVMKSLLE